MPELDSFCFTFSMANPITELFGGSNGHQLQWSRRLLWRVIRFDGKLYKKAFIKYLRWWKDGMFSPCCHKLRKDKEINGALPPRCCEVFILGAGLRTTRLLVTLVEYLLKTVLSWITSSSLSPATWASRDGGQRKDRSGFVRDCSLAWLFFWKVTTSAVVIGDFCRIFFPVIPDCSLVLFWLQPITSHDISTNGNCSNNTIDHFFELMET